MSKAKGKNAVCEVCGTRGLIRNTNGIDVCATCEKITGNVKNHISRIVEIARLMGKQNELVQALGVSGGAATITSEGAAQLEAAVTRARLTLINALPPLEESLDDTQCLQDIEDLAERAAPLVKSGRAWAELMRLAEEAGIGGLVAAHPPENLARQFVAKAVEPMEELDTLKRNAAELLGCPQDEIIQALRMEEVTMRTIREIVEPEVAGEEYGTITEACRLLAQKSRTQRRKDDDNDNDSESAALLRWANEKLRQGKIKLQVEVQEVEA